MRTSEIITIDIIPSEVWGECIHINLVSWSVQIFLSLSQSCSERFCVFSKFLGGWWYLSKSETSVRLCQLSVWVCLIGEVTGIYKVSNEFSLLRIEGQVVSWWLSICLGQLCVILLNLYRRLSWYLSKYHIRSILFSLFNSNLQKRLFLIANIALYFFASIVIHNNSNHSFSAFTLECLICARLQHMVGFLWHSGIHSVLEVGKHLNIARRQIHKHRLVVDHVPIGFLTSWGSVWVQDLSWEVLIKLDFNYFSVWSQIKMEIFLNELNFVRL